MIARLRRLAIDTTPLRHPAYRRLFVGNGVSFVGFQITAVAVPVQVYDISRSSFWVGMVGLVGLVPLIVFGLWGGAVADAVDRRLLLLASSTVTCRRHGRAARPGGAAAAQPGADPRAGRDAVGRVRRLLADPQRDHPAAAAPGAGAGGEHAQLHDEQRRDGARAAARRRGDRADGRLRGGVRDRRVPVHGGAVRRPAAAGAAAADRRDRPAGAAVRHRRAALHRRPAGAADVFRRGHHRDGLRHAAGAVPGGRRDPVRRRRGGRLAVRRDRDRRACSAGCRPAGSAGCAGRAWR